MCKRARDTPLSPVASCKPAPACANWIAILPIDSPSLLSTSFRAFASLLIVVSSCLLNVAFSVLAPSPLSLKRVVCSFVPIISPVSLLVDLSSISLHKCPFKIVNVSSSINVFSFSILRPLFFANIFFAIVAGALPNFSSPAVRSLFLIHMSEPPRPY